MSWRSPHWKPKRSNKINAKHSPRTGLLFDGLWLIEYYQGVSRDPELKSRLCTWALKCAARYATLDYGDDVGGLREIIDAAQNGATPYRRELLAAACDARAALFGDSSGQHLYWAGAAAAIREIDYNRLVEMILEIDDNGGRESEMIMMLCGQLTWNKQ